MFLVLEDLVGMPTNATQFLLSDLDLFSAHFQVFLDIVLLRRNWLCIVHPVRDHLVRNHCDLVFHEHLFCQSTLIVVLKFTHSSGEIVDLLGFFSKLSTHHFKLVALF